MAECFLCVPLPQLHVCGQTFLPARSLLVLLKIHMAAVLLLTSNTGWRPYAGSQDSQLLSTWMLSHFRDVAAFPNGVKMFVLSDAMEIALEPPINACCRGGLLWPAFYFRGWLCSSSVTREALKCQHNTQLVAYVKVREGNSYE